MFQKGPKILSELNELISSVENSNIQKNDKLKILKVLLVIKLKLFELLKEEFKKEAREIYWASPERSREGPQGISASYRASVAKNGGQNNKPFKKQNMIIQFIKHNSGLVSATKLLELRIAGRTLRRYIKNLSDSGKISVEKKGRQHFYAVIS